MSTNESESDALKSETETSPDELEKSLVGATPGMAENQERENVPDASLSLLQRIVRFVKQPLAALFSGGQPVGQEGEASSIFQRISQALANVLSDGAGTGTYDTLHWRDIIGWFADWMKTHQNIDGEVVGFTLREESREGKYCLVQGIFNKSSNSVEAARRIVADEIDDEVKSSCYGKEKVTLFT